MSIVSWRAGWFLATAAVLAVAVGSVAPQGPAAQTPEPEKQPGGCMEVLIISRAVFGILAVPLAVMIGLVLAIVALVALFSVHWLLGLAGIVAIGCGIALYARWERGRFRSGGP